MAEFKLAYMNREEARRWFIHTHAELLAGTDNRAKRQAWAACMHMLIREGGADPKQASRWMYPSDLDTYCPPVRAAAAPAAPTPIQPPPRMTNRQILEMLLHASENELSQESIMSVDIDGVTHLRPIQTLVIISEPMFMLQDGLCPASGLTEEDKMQHLEQVFNPGQILFTYAESSHDEPSPHAADSVLPDRERSAPPGGPALL